MLEVIQGDITKLEVDAIVNAANSGLRGGGGVDGAIHRAAGPQLIAECRRIIENMGSLPAGEAVITGGYNLAAKFVVQTVGPVWRDGKHGEPEKLWNAYYNSLKVSAENNVKSIAFPNISTGIYGYPKKEACDIAFDAVSNFLKENGFIVSVVFCCFDMENFKLYSDKLEKMKKENKL
jgi:O-acetyl-ADP-ribose deacetylase (regulator of RNase III)